VLDEQLDLFMDELLAAELTEQLRVEVRAMLEKGLK
jgi:hypothetical protein